MCYSWRNDIKDYINVSWPCIEIWHEIYGFRFLFSEPCFLLLLFSAFFSFFVCCFIVVGARNPVQIQIGNGVKLKSLLHKMRFHTQFLFFFCWNYLICINIDRIEGFSTFFVLFCFLFFCKY